MPNGECIDMLCMLMRSSRRPPGEVVYDWTVVCTTRSLAPSRPMETGVCMRYLCMYKYMYMYVCDDGLKSVNACEDAWNAGELQLQYCYTTFLILQYKRKSTRKVKKIISLKNCLLYCTCFLKNRKGEQALKE